MTFHLKRPALYAVQVQFLTFLLNKGNLPSGETCKSQNSVISVNLGTGKCWYDDVHTKDKILVFYPSVGVKRINKTSFIHLELQR